jgi:hypothetical protein
MKYGLTESEFAHILSTSLLVGEIDQLVYELYGLSEEEVRIVEGKS